MSSIPFRLIHYNTNQINIIEPFPQIKIPAEKKYSVLRASKKKNDKFKNTINILDVQKWSLFFIKLFQRFLEYLENCIPL